jgi:hypothetical protein
MASSTRVISSAVNVLTLAFNRRLSIAQTEYCERVAAHDARVFDSLPEELNHDVCLPPALVARAVAHPRRNPSRETRARTASTTADRT